jgi:uncharacterized protein YndB with AHSA1/START domain
MSRLSEKTIGAALQQPPPLKISRVFHAPRAAVFKAWSTADHVKRWFSPETYSSPEARVEMVVGGPFDVCMRSPSGETHWTRGRFVEVTPHSRLVIDMHAVDGKGEPIFRAYTEVDFSDALAGTRIDIVQTYTFVDPAIAAPMVGGAAEGWRTTLDKLEREVIRAQGGAEADARSVVHATFHLERTYDAPVSRASRALTDEAAKQGAFLDGYDDAGSRERGAAREP